MVTELVHTPEERARLHGGLCPQVACYHANGMNCIRAGGVPRQEDVEVCEVRSLESVIDVVNLFSRRFGTRYLTVAGMIA